MTSQPLLRIASTALSEEPPVEMSVLDDHNLFAGTKITLDEVLETVILGGGTDIDVGETEIVADERALGDSSGSDACHGLDFGEILENRA